MTAGPQSVPAGAYYLLHRAVALTNSSGYVVEASDTNVYGNTLIFTAPDSTGNWWSDSANQDYCYGASEINYCGYRFDPETQLYYVRNRTYNAVLGRWIQRDPIGYAGGINLYEYVGGMACSLMDGSGLGCFTDQMALYGAIVAVGTASVAAGIACRVAIVLKPEGEADLAVIAACIAAELIALGAFAGMVFALAALIHCEKAEPCPDKSEIKRQERRLDRDKKKMRQLRREIRRLRDRTHYHPPGTTEI